MKSNGFGLTDIGAVRETNEDALLIDDGLGLYAVADGLGGHAAGQEAARLAIAAVESSIREAHKSVGPGPVDHAFLRQIANDALKAACARVHTEATTVPELSGMGCALTLLVISEAKAAMAHVGDTRLYLCREGSTWQLSADHTLAADLVRRGEITAEQAKTHPYASALSRAIGPQMSVESDTLILDILPDDVFLLCSDGLSQYIEGPGELSTALGSDQLDQTPHRLVDLANERGGRDNVTALVVRVTAERQEQEETLSTDIRSGLRALRKLPAFETARFPDLVRIFNLAEIRSYSKGENVAVDQDQMQALYIPLAGEIDLVRADGTSTRIRRGDVVGLTSLLVPRKSTARLNARSDLRLLVVGREKFRQLVRRRPWMGIRVLLALATELELEISTLHEDDSLHVIPTTPWWSPRTWFARASR